MQFHTKLIIRCPGQTAQPAFLLMNRYKGWRVSSGATLASLKVPVSWRLHSPVQSIFVFPTKSFPSYSFHVLTVQLDVCQGKCMWWFTEVERQRRCLVENVSDHYQSALPSVSLCQIKIHLRFVRHWLWLNSHGSFFPRMSRITKVKFYLLYDGRRLDEVNRGTSGSYGAGNDILSLRLLIFYRWAAAISDICRSAPALPAPPTRGGFLCSRQINAICWWPDVHQRLPASEPVLGWGGGVE